MQHSGSDQCNLFRWAWDDVGGRKDDCIISESSDPKGPSSLQTMESAIPRIKGMIDQPPPDLEDFLKILGGVYHDNGHNAVGNGMYRV